MLRLTKISDSEVVRGLQNRDRRTEEWFYKSANGYFSNHFNDIFFDKDRKQEIFQSSFLKLWSEICDGRIRVVDGIIVRRQKNDTYAPMTCALTTFLMAFARNEFRELIRSNRLEDSYSELLDNMGTAEMIDIPFDGEEDVEEQKRRIVDECIEQLPPRCVEVLTLFYYQGKSLDEILKIRQEHNSSKNGLKTAKNKCMNTLRERITIEFAKYKLKV